MSVIRDGSGNTYGAQVDSDHRLATLSTIQSEQVNVSRSSGLAFTTRTDNLVVNSLNEHSLLYINNGSYVNNLNIHQFCFSWNGGNTSHVASMRVRIYKNSDEPSANYTDAVMTNLNWGSNASVEITGYKWDGVGNGMTFSGGTVVWDSWAGPGYTTMSTDGLPILKNGDSIMLSVQCDEIGYVAHHMNFFMLTRQ